MSTICPQNIKKHNAINKINIINIEVTCSSKCPNINNIINMINTYNIHIS